jgi:hypothetical protein
VTPDRSPPEPVEWLDWRCEVTRRKRALGRDGSTEPAWSRSVPLELAEARDRRAPLVIVLLDFGHPVPEPLATPEVVRLLDERFVLVLAQKDHKKHKKGADERHGTALIGGEARCQEHPLLTCADHDAARDALRDGALPAGDVQLADDEDARVLVCDPDGKPLSSFSDDPASTGLARLEPAALRDALAAAATLAGRDAVSLGDLEAALAADKDLAQGNVGAGLGALRRAARDRRPFVRAWADAYLSGDALAPRLGPLVDRLVAEAGPSRTGRARLRRELERLRKDLADAPSSAQRVVDAVLERLD